MTSTPHDLADDADKLINAAKTGDHHLVHATAERIARDHLPDAAIAHAFLAGFDSGYTAGSQTPRHDGSSHA